MALMDSFKNNFSQEYVFNSILLIYDAFFSYADLPSILRILVAIVTL